MALSKLNAKIEGIKYLPFEQDGKTYNLYDMPKGFVIKADLDLSDIGLTELPDLSEVVVKGDFYCSDNQLTSLEGSPQKVDGDFICSCNKLTSLEGAPQRVGGGFYCSINQLTSLEGAPKEVGGKFDCSYNQLTSLEGAPQTVGGDFNCYENRLTTLEGAPQSVGGYFRCYNNQLTSLVGLPQMKECMKIYCDYSLGNKYGLDWAFSYEQLCASPLYRSEDAMNRVRNKLPQENIETKPASTKQQEKAETETKTKQQQEAFEKTNAEFSQWLKDNSIKLTRE